VDGLAECGGLCEVACDYCVGKNVKPEHLVVIIYVTTLERLKHDET